jgi:hypothetical protein
MHIYSVEQLLGLLELRDGLMRRISAVIAKLLTKVRYSTTFDHLERSCNIAGLLIEQKRRKERKRMMDELQGVQAASTRLTTFSSTGEDT